MRYAALAFLTTLFLVSHDVNAVPVDTAALSCSEVKKAASGPESTIEAKGRMVSLVGWMLGKRTPVGRSAIGEPAMANKLTLRALGTCMKAPDQTIAAAVDKVIADSGIDSDAPALTCRGLLALPASERGTAVAWIHGSRSSSNSVDIEAFIKGLGTLANYCDRNGDMQVGLALDAIR